MMRDCPNNRAGFDRVLMTVAATFLAVTATSAQAQSGPPRASAADLAIDAAVPRPEPANVPPPTVNDFKPDPVKADVTASTTDMTKPADAPKADAPKVDAAKAIETPAA